MANGNGGFILKAFVGVGASAIIAVTSFNGTKIDRNKDSNEAQHIKIVETMIERDEKLAEHIHHFDVRQEVLIKSVENIAKKLN